MPFVLSSYFENMLFPEFVIPPNQILLRIPFIWKTNIFSLQFTKSYIMNMNFDDIEVISSFSPTKEQLISFPLVFSYLIIFSDFLSEA